VELITVIAILSVLSVLVMPNVSSMLSGNSLNTATDDISLILSQARSYAMGHQTFVYVGFEETDATQNPYAVPQTALATGGRLYVSAIATVDGSFGTNPFSTSSAWSPSYDQDNSGNANLVMISKPQVFNNVSLVSTVPNPSSGNMARPTAGVQVAGTTSPTYFYFPVSSASAAVARCNFQQVIRFDPQGVATVAGSLYPWIEIGLEPTHGNQAAATVTDCSAIQIEGTTGSVRVYRP
jgi:type II secretory pathway pseudopilin PulG